MVTCVWCGFFLLKLFQPALNSSHDIGWNQHFLTSLCTNHSCHHQHQWQTATITSIFNTNARDDKGRGFKTQMSLKPLVCFFSLFFYTIDYTKDDNEDRGLRHNSISSLRYVNCDGDDEHTLSPNTWTNKGAWDASASWASGKFLLFHSFFFALLMIFFTISLYACEQQQQQHTPSPNTWMNRGAQDASASWASRGTVIPWSLKHSNKICKFEIQTLLQCYFDYIGMMYDM